MTRQPTPDIMADVLTGQPTVQQLAHSQIRTDGGTQPRAEISNDLVTEYAEAMTDGAPFPPVVIFFDGSDYWLADGFHRLRALASIGRPVAADVRQGTRRDAVLYSVGANATHGQRRTNADKRRAVMALLQDEEWQGWSDREIARRCAVSYMTVARIRSELDYHNVTVDSNVRTGADGRTINTSNIGKRQEPAKPPLEIWKLERYLRMWLDRNVAEVDRSTFLTDFGKWDVREPVTLWIREQQPDASWRGRDMIQAGNNIREQLRQALQAATQQPRPEPQPEPVITPMAAAAPALATDLRMIGIWHNDSRQIAMMPEIPLESVDLVITSPPYNVGIEYSEHFDKMQQEQYLTLLSEVFTGCHSVMRHGARIAVVVPFGIGRNPWHPLSLFVANVLQKAGFTLRGQIIWDKGSSGNRTSWGSFRSPSDPSLRDTSECIIVAHKSQSQAAVPNGIIRRDDKGSYSPWLESSEYFMELAQDHWRVAPESAQRVGHPAPFPVELVRRLVHFYGWPGCTLLDPFAGSGTVGVAALELGCDANLVEKDAAYCELARRRIAAARGEIVE